MEQILSPESFHVAATVLAKLAIAVILGGAIGFERELHGRPAGLRTHMLVAMGVVLFCIISAAYAGSDPTRISAQVVTGIGFLGAGTILRLGAEVKGLTSAASIWATSAIAMAVARGGPYLIVASVSTFMALVTLGTIERMEKRFRPKTLPHELLVILERRGDLHELIAKLNSEGFEIDGIRVLQNTPQIEVSLLISGSMGAAMQAATTVHGVLEAHWAEGSP
jgi:putative Mg2+ transporter-C (MgtC) family protein